MGFLTVCRDTFMWQDVFEMCTHKKTLMIFWSCYKTQHPSFNSRHATLDLLTPVINISLAWYDHKQSGETEAFKKCDFWRVYIHVVQVCTSVQKWRDMWPSIVTLTQKQCSAFIPSKCILECFWEKKRFIKPKNSDFNCLIHAFFDLILYSNRRKYRLNAIYWKIM